MPCPYAFPPIGFTSPPVKLSSPSKAVITTAVDTAHPRAGGPTIASWPNISPAGLAAHQPLLHPLDLTVNELLPRYWGHAQTYDFKDDVPTFEPETIRQALRLVRELYGDTRARDFGPLAFQAVRQAMIDRDWCRTYINKQVDRIKRIFSWSVANELPPVTLD